MSREGISGSPNSIPAPDDDALTERVAAVGDILRQAVVPEDLVNAFLQQVTNYLRESPGSAAAADRLRTFFASARSPLSWLALFEREPAALHVLIDLLGAAPRLAEELVREPEAFELVRLTGGRPVQYDVLLDELLTELRAVTSLQHAQRVLKNYRRRETLRIAYGEMIGVLSTEEAAQQLSFLADAIVQGTIEFSVREASKYAPVPTQSNGSPVRFCVIAFGDLAGHEMDYADEMQLMFVRDDLADRPAWQEPLDQRAVAQFYDRVLRTLMQVLAGDGDEQPPVYRVQIVAPELRDETGLVFTMQQAIVYFDSWGRTWQRQVFVKARPIAGDRDLGEEVLSELQPWIYRQYLMDEDVTGMVMLKRRLERKLTDLESDFSQAPRDILDWAEALITFLQLLYGSTHPDVRVCNTIEAIDRLAAIGALTAREAGEFSNTYRTLRRLHHALQTLVGTTARELPSDAMFQSHLVAWARRGAAREDGAVPGCDRPLEEVMSSCTDVITNVGRAILDRTVLGESSLPERDDPAAQLILDPQPDEREINATLHTYRLADPAAAYRRLQEMAVESVPYLSSRRSRLYLALIAHRLLAAIANTPNPDATLITLANIATSIGGKATLWQLFHESDPAMQLCVRLSAGSPYLSDILISNPGMLDELVDSLRMPTLPSHAGMREMVDELCRQADDVVPLLQSFKNMMHLRIGVREMLGASPIEMTHAALADVAEVIMDRVVQQEFEQLVRQMGMPMRRTGTRPETQAEFCVVAVGKFGAREPNYHSDLDLVFLFEGEGATVSQEPDPTFSPVTNRHFFNRLAQRVIQALTGSGGSAGRLFAVDTQLRPLGRNGPLAITVSELQQYFSDQHASIWEVMALCKARPIWGDPMVRNRVSLTVRQILTSQPWSPAMADAIYRHRLDLQQSASDRNIKRGRGGTMDIEFAVQALQLAAVDQHPNVLVPGTLAAIERLRAADQLEQQVAEVLARNYMFLRTLESGIRLMDYPARHEIPDTADDLKRLAYLLDTEQRLGLRASELPRRTQQVQRENRQLMEQIFDRWR